jgi:hypothetical protein
MSEIIVSLSGLGQFTLSLDLVDQPEPSDLDQSEVWRATFCDKQSDDCEVVYFEMGEDYEMWDLIDEAIQTYRME